MLARWDLTRGWRRPPATVEDRNVRNLIAQTAFAGVIQGGVTAFLPVMLARMGAGAITVSLLNSSLALTSIVMAIPSGPLVERQRRLVGWSARYYLVVRALYRSGEDPSVAGAVVGHSPVVALRHYRDVTAESRVQREGAFPQINVLIDRDEESRLHELHASLADRYVDQGVTLAITGPWPPYTFANA